MSTSAKCLMQLDFLDSGCYFQRACENFNLSFCSAPFVLQVFDVIPE
jgi:hypothetical protein